MLSLYWKCQIMKDSPEMSCLVYQPQFISHCHIINLKAINQLIIWQILINLFIKRMILVCLSSFCYAFFVPANKILLQEMRKKLAKWKHLTSKGSSLLLCENVLEGLNTIKQKWCFIKRSLNDATMLTIPQRRGTDESFQLVSSCSLESHEYYI